jgi:long-subunit acyl-CoA synthetase (AMP-forming)
MTGKVEGEVYVKGPGIFKYYFNKEEATRKAFDFSRILYDG